MTLYTSVALVTLRKPDDARENPGLVARRNVYKEDEVLPNIYALDKSLLTCHLLGPAVP